LAIIFFSNHAPKPAALAAVLRDFLLRMAVLALGGKVYRRGRFKNLRAL
jgi:hypothetical protein